MRSFVMSREDVQQDAEKHNVSPRRASLRDKATANVQKKAESVTKTALKKSPTSALTLGDIVLVPLDEVNRTKVEILLESLCLSTRIKVLAGLLQG